MLPNLGTGELLILLALGLLVFGAKKVPEIARSIGKSVNSFKAGMREEADPENR
ncbi:MAG: twin-arginine translocase TatA/TatE family subunit [Elusimicrobia bacterium CG_4_9_14_3_um_filter_62_55]|nr:MAG: twin-arginine translocase TatA/TatE family subunit [Elusimicrobia bacterium CG22_combo_CG10-13_8_21_14_all_63_91]PJA11667.1 MAG: twin-arginine translocase TatA/TatE family subunit [Elusimicrobia bacterium CG_4_10_14_0_2_um_filter_63_34]PJB23080.1 MAG: twin-arginine translocase TatA/TatE family subunit [Elusimicrobia bacterium CG_4_9_14_3_um_filter_62_55]